MAMDAIGSLSLYGDFMAESGNHGEIMDVYHG